MATSLVHHPATRYSADDLATIFNRSYGGYAVNLTTTGAAFARRVREEFIDLAASFVAEFGGEPAGICCLARQGPGTWCGGFGLYPEYRGRGFAREVAAEMLRRARNADAAWLQLEVLTTNAAAFATYQRAGFKITRDLLVLDWRPDVVVSRPGPARTRRCAPAAVLDLLRLAHRPTPCWQRSLASLHARSDLEGYASADRSVALLLTRMPGAAARLLAFHGEDVAALTALLREIQSEGGALRVINEPPDSPHLAALTAAGFVETLRQHEMRVEL